MHFRDLQILKMESLMLVGVESCWSGYLGAKSECPDLRCFLLGKSGVCGPPVYFKVSGLYGCLGYYSNP